MSAASAAAVPSAEAAAALRCADDAPIGVGDTAAGKAIVARAQAWAFEKVVPINVAFELTERCNIRCLHCYNHDRDRQEGACADEAPELSTDEILRVLGEVREAGCMFLAFTGGEALAHPELFTFLDRARDLNMAVQLLSNGTLLRPGVAARLATYRNLLGVSVSIYGATPEVHDGITQVRGSFRRTWDGVRRLRAAGVVVRLKLILMRQNAHEVAAMRAQAEAEGHPYLVDLTITARHDGTRGSLTTRIGRADLERLYRGPLRDLVQDGPKPADGPCNCARGNAAISARGDVYPCISVPWSGGNVRERPFAEIWRDSPVFQRLRGLRLADYPSCAPCDKRDYCSRNRGAAFTASGDYTGVDPFVCETAEVTRAVAESKNEQATGDRR